MICLSVDDVFLLSVALHCLKLSIYLNTVWLIKSVRSSVGNTFPGVGWPITRSYRTLGDSNALMLAHTWEVGTVR